MRVRRNIRWLKAGDQIPPGEPKRSRGGSNNEYVVLRWLTDTERLYALEHRVVAGLDAEAVHHINEVKSDNRPENLARMSMSEHSRHHLGGISDAAAAQRLRAEGWSWAQLAARFGVASATARRTLHRLGTPMSRTVSQGKVEQQSWLRDINDNRIAVGEVERYLALGNHQLRRCFMKARLLNASR